VNRRPYEDEDGLYRLTPEAAEAMADPVAFRRALQDAFGEDEGDAYMMVMRLIQGREQRELDPPNGEEIAVLLTDFATVTTLATLYGLAFKGLVYVDVVEEDGDTQVGFQITADGLEVIAREGRLY
jgi:hypothetical protein